MNKLNVFAQIADMKEIDYKNTLAIASLIDILIDKKIIDKNDIMSKSHELDEMSIDEIRTFRLKK